MFDLQQIPRRVLSISELTQIIKQSLESSFPLIWVQGEISNCRKHSSGHYYFTLKDEGAQLSAVMWRSRAEGLLFTPEDGIKVQARGALTVYPPRGNYQIDVLRLLPVGVGELQQAFEALKQKLQAEGLFDPSRKRPIPRFPDRIGIITSPTGAALQDIRSVLSRRFPSLNVVVVPVRVQGVGAAEEIARAVEDVNRYGELDCVILARGGGSLEDLWAFNEEVVARAIFASEIPVISAVGHEIDFSIADFTADLRAPTPSSSAELVAPDRAEIIDILRNSSYTMRQRLADRIAQMRQRVEHLVLSYSFNRPKDLLVQYSQRVDELEKSLASASFRLFEKVQKRFLSLQQQLNALGPRNVLRRGYAMIQRDNRTITRAVQLKQGDETEIHFFDGAVPARIQRNERKETDETVL
ncbi:MAG: exodeoxyribonuclease VII large subunit [Ignavibacteriales bacterium]|nr:exodeoxyribonuclease VII large subunit [Ignavibacteriales bacterium]